MSIKGPSIELVDVRKSYSESQRTHHVLADSSLSIESGERVAVLGPSGSGKSTLLNLVSGIDLADSGIVRVGGRDLATLAERERTLFRRRHVGFVFQFFNLIPTLTVEENLALPLELNEVDGADRVWSLLEEVGLGDRADSFPDRLSGGEQQRVAIARALIHRPGLILADEPTGNLDQETGTVVVDLLERLVREAGATMIVVTHAQSLAAQMDRTVRVDRGRLVEE